jgi:hypothetical protein
MIPYTLTDLDELVLTVRNSNTKEYINEAVHAYRSGLNRAAVILTWTAVAYDLIGKYRELSDQSESAAVQFVKDLDNAISSNNVAQLQAIENRLLDLARDPFEIVTDAEKNAFERLKADRNLCAHPAFTGESVLFNPLPEQVRAHIVLAVKAILQQAPVQGKAAFARLKADLLQASFPRSQEQIRTFLSKRYFTRLKKSLIPNLVTILAKEIVLQKDPELATVPDNVAQTLVAVGEAYPTEYESQLKEGLPRYAAGVDDEKLWHILLLLGNDLRVWQWIDEPTRIRVRNLVQGKIKADQVSYLPLAFKVPDLAALLRDKFEQFDDEKKEKFIAAVPAAELADEAIRIFADSGGWRTAEARTKNLIIPLAQTFSPDQIRRILIAAASNGEIWNAAEVPELMRNFFRLTSQSRDATREDWRGFIEKVKPLRESEHWDAIETLL